MPTEAPMLTFPFKRPGVLGIPPELADWRAKGPMTRVQLADGSQAWLATTYQLARALFRMPLSADTARPEFPQADPTVHEFRRGMGSFVRMDPPEHDRQRRMVTKEFTIKRVDAMRGHLTEVSHDLLDDFARAGSPADLVSIVAKQMPALVMCELLALPDADSEFFHDRVEQWSDFDRPASDRSDAVADLLNYFSELIAERGRAEEQPDLVSRLVWNELRAGEISEHDLAHMLLILLLGGFDTTANMIALGTALLLENPDQLASVKADPSLWPNAVEEMLRYLTISHNNAIRLATEDFEIAGVTVRAGEAVVFPILAANHDPAAFPNPSSFEVAREGARSHLGFSFGIHQCLGQALARAELQAILPLIFSRFPDLQLAVPIEEVRVRNTLVHAVAELPLTWSVHKTRDEL